jgi:hypothetical protein
MKLTNNQIYTYASNLAAFNIDVKLPVRINFYLQKNIQLIQTLAQEIDTARINIAKEFGELTEDGSAYTVPPENMAAAKQELSDLFNLTQEVNIYMLTLDDFDGIELTMQQLDAIMFMIEE